MFNKYYLVFGSIPQRQPKHIRSELNTNSLEFVGRDSGNFRFGLFEQPEFEQAEDALDTRLSQRRQCNLLAIRKRF